MTRASMDAASPHDRKTWRTWLALAAPIAFAAWVAIDGLRRFPMWDAEEWTRRVALLPLGGMLAEVAADRHPPLFFLLEWVLVRLQDSDALLRAPAGLATVAMVAGTAWLARRFGGDGAALVTGALLATSPFVYAYAATARASIVIGLVGAGVLATSVAIARGPRPERAALAQAALLATGLWLHYGAVCAAAGAGLAALAGPWLAPDADRHLRRAGLGVASVLASGATLLPWALGPASAQSPSSEVVVWSADVLRYLYWPVGPAWAPQGAGILLTVAGVGAGLAIRRHPDRGVLLGWIVAALAVPLALGGTQGFSVKAYFFAPFLPLFALLVGRVATAHAWAWAPLAALVVGFQVPGLLHTRSLPSNLASISERAVAAYDARRDVAVLRAAQAATNHTIEPGSRGAEELFHYAPELHPKAIPGRPVVWHPADRNVKEVAAPSAYDDTTCRLAYAFTVTMVVPTADCAAFLAALAERAEGYGPYELELGNEAMARGDAAGGEALLRRAMDHSPGWGLPESVLAGWLLEAGRSSEALDVLASGAAKAAEHGRVALWRHLEAQRERAGKDAGRATVAGHAQRVGRCLVGTFDAWEARRCASR